LGLPPWRPPLICFGCLCSRPTKRSGLREHPGRFPPGDVVEVRGVLARGQPARTAFFPWLLWALPVVSLLSKCSCHSSRGRVGEDGMLEAVLQTSITSCCGRSSWEMSMDDIDLIPPQTSFQLPLRGLGCVERGQLGDPPARCKLNFSFSRQRDVNWQQSDLLRSVPRSMVACWRTRI